MTEIVEMKILTQENKDEFLKELISCLCWRFEVTREEDLPENYSWKVPWSLLNLLKDDKLDSYQLLYVDGNFWGGTGSIIRVQDNRAKIFQAGFRTFAKAHHTYKGIGMKSFITGYCIKYQIERAKKSDCEKIVISFNLENERLFKVLNAYHHKQKHFGIADLMKDFVPTKTPVIFNGVEQWLLEMNLK